MKKKGLLIIDMQNDFVSGALGTPEALEILPYVAARISDAAKDPQYSYIAYTLDTHGEDYLSTQEGRRLPVKHCIHGTQGHALAEDVAGAMPAWAVGFEKNGFGSAQLARALPEDLDEVELIGLCTDICVIANAMVIKSIRPELGVCVRGGCCAGVTPASHETALKAMAACQIDIV